MNFIMDNFVIIGIIEDIRAQILSTLAVNLDGEPKCERTPRFILGGVDHVGHSL